MNRRCLVVKFGGETVSSPDLPAIACDLRTLANDGFALVVSHGGGPQATALSKRLGLEPRIVGGRRITDDATLEVMKLVIAGQTNVDLSAQLRAVGLRPIGLHDVVRATKRPPRLVTGGGDEPIDFGHVGDVTGFDVGLLVRLFDAGYVPVIACLGHDDAGQVFNINADVVANQLAGALQADALVLLTNTNGVLQDVNDPSSRISRLTVSEAQRAIEAGTISSGMIPKLEESLAALSLGTRAIVITQGEVARALRSPGSVGTVLVP